MKMQQINARHTPPRPAFCAAPAHRSRRRIPFSVISPHVTNIHRTKLKEKQTLIFPPPPLTSPSLSHLPPTICRNAITQLARAQHEHRHTTCGARVYTAIKHSINHLSQIFPQAHHTRSTHKPPVNPELQLRTIAHTLQCPIHGLLCFIAQHHT